MTCRTCNETPFEYPYRWRAATISILACPTHAQEVLEALRAAQGGA